MKLKPFVRRPKAISIEDVDFGIGDAIEDLSQLSLRECYGYLLKVEDSLEGSDGTIIFIPDVYPQELIEDDNGE